MTFPDVDIPLFRLDYSNEQAWNDVLHTALGEESERTDPLTIVDDPEFDGMDIDDLLARLNEDDPGCRFFVIADAATFTETDHPFTLVTATSPPHRLPIAAHTVSDVVANFVDQQPRRRGPPHRGRPGRNLPSNPTAAHRTAGRTIEVEEIVDAMGDGPWPGTLEEFRLGLLEYRARAGFRAVTTLVNTNASARTGPCAPLGVP